MERTLWRKIEKEVLSFAETQHESSSQRQWNESYGQWCPDVGGKTSHLVDVGSQQTPKPQLYTVWFRSTVVTLESFIFRKHPCGLKADDGGGTASEKRCIWGWSWGAKARIGRKIQRELRAEHYFFYHRKFTPTNFRDPEELMLCPLPLSISSWAASLCVHSSLRHGRSFARGDKSSHTSQFIVPHTFI